MVSAKFNTDIFLAGVCLQTLVLATLYRPFSDYETSASKMSPETFSLDHEANSERTDSSLAIIDDKVRKKLKFEAPSILHLNHYAFIKFGIYIHASIRLS